MPKVLLTTDCAILLSASTLTSLGRADEGPPIVPQQEKDETGPGRYGAAEPDKAQEPEDAREYESRKGSIDGVAPATSEDVSPTVPRAADEAISPRREAEEEEIGRRIETWQDRIETLRAEARAQSDAELSGMVEDVQDDFTVLVHQWRRLQQTDDEDQWEAEMPNFRAAVDRFEAEWKDKIEEGREGA
jgi:hypothetical protein